MPGFVRSDMTAVARLKVSFSTAKDNREAIRQGLEAGVDLQLYDFTHEEWMESIRSLVESGELSGEVLDTACGRVLKLKFALGLFENPYVDESLYDKTVNCKAHQETALDIARKSIYLLKNDKHILPLSDACRTIAVVGPGADEAALGDYAPKTADSHKVTVLDGIRQLAGENRKVLYEKGCSYLGEKVTPFYPDWFVSEDGEQGLTARYYNNWDLSGEPVVTRRDHMINFNWIYAKPHGDVNAECFSVAWTGRLKARSGFQGCIAIPGQDSMRLYVDGKLLIDAWNQGRDDGAAGVSGSEGSQGAGMDAERDSRMADFTFEADREYDIRTSIAYTIIITADHGGHGRSHGSMEKEDMLIPLVCTGPDFQPGKVFERASICDIAPTIAALTGAAPAPEWEGKSLLG